MLLAHVDCLLLATRPNEDFDLAELQNILRCCDQITVLLKSIRQSRVTGVLDVRNFASCHASPRLLANILFATVGSKFRFRGARSKLPWLWALST
jgi:hypothetical protein